ncbi:uncharacterized protein TA12395 [Theileria annulata]|uniref:RAP domain-containing protein n=1 Tax=Theileria annulata TaxID=5874 RepID=Q4UDZ9_THEAN|nr:uncharacterized protein TA12395 [Theileria annulata]CAI74690.1 hypothetical protein, conserved [Theileria annulata]|eukprot:XP_952422.1 hypothetical protein, conserved [Theileria annulata]
MFFITSISMIPYHNLNIITLNSKVILHTKRYFTHYRFHKRVGKGNWNRYVERYTKPASIENTQPIHFNYKASYQSTKNSLSYLWDLPKKIAAATSSNKLLESWIYYRHKRKKLYHYVLALKRLNEIKEVDISDWRFKLIVKKVIKRSRYFTGIFSQQNSHEFSDLPTVCLYLGNLKCVDAIEKVTYHLIERMEYYSPLQLGRICSAFSSCRIFNKYLFSLVATRFISLIDIAENASILAVARVILQFAFSNCMVYNFRLFNSVSLEFLRRLSNDIAHSKERQINCSHLMFSFKTSHRPPNVDQLVNLVPLAESFGISKYKDLNYFETLSNVLIDNLNTCEIVEPSIISRAISVYNKLKINDVQLLEIVMILFYLCWIRFILSHITFLQFSKSHSIASIMKDISSMIPRGLNLHTELTDIAIFAKNTGLANVELINSIQNSVLKNSVKDQSPDYDCPRLFEILSSKSNLTEDSFKLFCLYSRRLLNKFEPCDFLRVSRLLRRHKGLNTNVILPNLMGIRLAELNGEFSTYQYNCVARDLTLSGKVQEGILAEVWRKNTYNKGFKPPSL